MTIVLPHGVLFLSGSQERIRTKLLGDGHIDVLKKCEKPDDVLFINATERHTRCVEMAEIELNGHKLNISRYISTAVAEPEIDLKAVDAELADIERTRWASS